ncbi:hypothetical protein U1737_04860 [Sphingomonas sp. LB3N6]|uniref:hypothetical protein n=1 Tax=Sphingomonas fucosidasi TaxID=3096164 RepID=UPI002FCC9689
MKLPLVHNRISTTERDYRAGCCVCWGGTVRWKTANAQALAVQHHDRTGHETWCDIDARTKYGRSAPDDRQTDIEDAIASASSGDAPGCAPLPGNDAPTVPAAGVSAPQGRSSKHALTAAKPEILAS